MLVGSDEWVNTFLGSSKCLFINVLRFPFLILISSDGKFKARIKFEYPSSETKK